MSVSYKDMATAFAEILLSSGLRLGSSASAKQICPLCAEGDCDTEAGSSKEWASNAHLQRHLQSAYHSKSSRLQRLCKKRAADNDGGFICPFCEGVSPVGNDLKSYGKWSDLATHIRLSDVDRINGNRVDFPGNDRSRANRET